MRQQQPVEIVVCVPRTVVELIWVRLYSSSSLFRTPEVPQLQAAGAIRDGSATGKRATLIVLVDSMLREDLRDALFDTANVLSSGNIGTINV